VGGATFWDPDSNNVWCSCQLFDVQLFDEIIAITGILEIDRSELGWIGNCFSGFWCHVQDQEIRWFLVRDNCYYIIQILGCLGSK